MTRLYRSEDDRILGGVCGGIAEIYDLDPSLVRILTLLLILSGVTPVLYLAAWLIIPPESEVVDSEKDTGEVEGPKGQSQEGDEEDSEASDSDE